MGRGDAGSARQQGAPNCLSCTCLLPSLASAGGEYPPTVYISMEQDVSTAERIRTNVQVLRDDGVPVQMVKVRLPCPPGFPADSHSPGA